MALATLGGAPWSRSARWLMCRPTNGARDLGFTSLLALARQGEHGALTQIYRAYQPRILRYLRAQEPDMADDLAADVWLAVARGLGRFQGDEGGFRSWIFTIARHRVVEHRRRQQRRRTDPVPDERLDHPVERGLGGDPAWLVVERVGAQQAIEAVVRELPPDQAEAVLLRVLGGFDVAEVARIMGRTPGNVRVLCHRALRRLAARRSAEAEVVAE
ncbi:MAG: sigma-70 family RNA polymerase sigma factor [Thermoanaerobacterales bacterium]